MTENDFQKTISEMKETLQTFINENFEKGSDTNFVLAVLLKSVLDNFYETGE